VRSQALAPFRDRRLWTFAAANCLNGIPYSIWSNWTTKYLVTVYGLTPAAANTFAWIPPVFAMLGGFLIGLLAAFSDGYLNARWTNAWVFATLVLILLFRPNGLLGEQTGQKA
jgi:sugar phosphate permease